MTEDVKIITETEALNLIEQALSRAIKPIISFSGGKDSTVVLHLVRRIAPNIPARFANTGVESPETIEFIKTVPNLIEVGPLKSFWKCVKEYGLPRPKVKAKSHGNMCCKYLKERPQDKHSEANGIDLEFSGLTAAESNQRKLTLMRMGPLYQLKNGRWRCHPIHDWTEADVWDYIHRYNIPYNSIYDKGARRCGCQPCTAYRNWKKNLARENPKLLRWILKIQGQSQLCDAECSGGA